MNGPGTILVDFDGTISQVDIGSRLLDRATQGGARAVVDLWRHGRIGSRQCLIMECALARATAEEIRAFALEQPVDPGFGTFLRAAEDRGWQVIVVSDGLDLYIRPVLEREGWGHLPVHSNRLRVVGDRLLPSFPFAGRGCGACGNCKRASVADAGSGGEVVFIGNGLSDRCGARAADRVFARDELLRWCRERDVAHTPFEDFFVVTENLFGVQTVS